MRASYIFPVLIIMFIALFYIACPSPDGARLMGKNPAFGRKDALALGVIMLLYSAAAFWGLGDTSAPESFHRFESGERAVIDLGQVQGVEGLTLYPGLNTGSYRIEYSADGVNWRDGASFEQNYVSLFKWADVGFADGVVPARYIRLTAAGDVWLGELAVNSAEGHIAASSQASELADEQALIPDAASYLNSTYFDEIYHARTAFENLEGIYPYEVSHPPLGKLIIAIGIQLFGMTPFGWRFSGTLFGVLMLPAMYVLIKRLFGSSQAAACGAAIFAFDFMHFSQTRLATIDTYAVFFILLMYLFMYAYITTDKTRHFALSGLFFGIGAACKWTCIYAGAGLAVIWLIYQLRHFDIKHFAKSSASGVLFFILVPAVIYYASYYPYGQASGLHGIGMYFTSDYANIVLDNQKFMFTYHSGVNAEHPYSSRWWQWIINERPILYYLNYFDDGTRSSFGAFLNPVVCWGGLGAMVICAVYSIRRRDNASLFIVVGYLSQLLPWVFITRTTFEYHYFPSSVFLVLAICRVLSLIRCNTRNWRFSVYGLTALSCALFVMFYPVLSGMRVNSQIATNLLKWLPNWPF